MLPLSADPSDAMGVVSFDDDAWDDLLNFIEEKRVIPVVGSELLTVLVDGRPEHLYTWLARTLEARLGWRPPLPTELRR